MPEFLQLMPPSEALQRFLSYFDLQPQEEEIETRYALGRVTTRAVVAPHPLPSFNRSTVDGYAVRAADTFGASDSLPAYLNLQGEILMGAAADLILQPGSCALIHTGGMLPEGADAVVMVENTREVIHAPNSQEALKVFSPAQVEILRAVAVGENVILMGEDVAVGQGVIPAGTRLRPAEIGGLAALGITRLLVARPPRLGILSTGDEVVAPEEPIQPGQVRDVNTATLSALAYQLGGLPVSFGILPDQEARLMLAAQQAFETCDLIVITAGSSASVRDLTAQVIGNLGPPGVLVHGINIRPGKPTILAACQQGNTPAKPVIGLPGNPVSALVIAQLFVAPVIQRLLGLPADRIQPSVFAYLTTNLASQAGREDWTPVRLLPAPPPVRPARPDSPGIARYQADPIFGKSNLIFTLARADGLIRIHADATGLASGSLVEVILL